MNKKELIKAIASEPDIMDIEVAIKNGKTGNTVYRRVVKVERRHRQDIGRDVISLVCAKSLTKEKELFRDEDKARKVSRKAILKEAFEVEQQQPQTEDLADQGQENEPTEQQEQIQDPDSDTGESGDLSDKAFDMLNTEKEKQHLTMADLPRLVKKRMEQDEPGQSKYDEAFEQFNTFDQGDSESE